MTKDGIYHLKNASELKYSHNIYGDEEGKEKQLVFKQEIYKDENFEYHLTHGDFEKDDYR